MSLTSPNIVNGLWTFIEMQMKNVFVAWFLVKISIYGDGNGEETVEMLSSFGLTNRNTLFQHSNFKT